MTERLPLATPPYDAKVQEAISQLKFGELAPTNLLRALAHHPRLMTKVWALGGAFLWKSTIPKREQEIVVIRVAARTRSEYEWGMHVALFAEQCGLAGDDVHALTFGGSDDDRWNARESLLIQMVDELHQTSTLSGRVWDGMAKEWDNAEIVELILTAGYFHMMSFLLNGTGVPLEQGSERFSSLQPEGRQP